MTGELVARTAIDMDNKRYRYFVKRPKGAKTWTVMRQLRSAPAGQGISEAGGCFDAPCATDANKYLYYVRDGNVYRSKRATRRAKAATARATTRRAPTTQRVTCTPRKTHCGVAKS